MGAIYLPKPIAGYFNRQVANIFRPDGGSGVDFTSPEGEGALYEPDSLAWRAYKNPVTVFIGGVSAVLMQLAEPGVRSGVWEHSNFKEQTRARVRRTALASMTQVYGPKSEAEKMRAHVNRMHERVTGTTPDGKPYNANDPKLLGWVFNTATYGFLSAYGRFGPGVTELEIDKGLTATADNVAPLWGVTDVLRNGAEVRANFNAMLPNLESHPFLDEFMDIIKEADLMPRYLRPVQRLLVRAAVSNMPDNIRAKVGLDKHGLKPGEEMIVKMIGRFADRVYLESHPAVDACKRLGLPNDFLYSRPVRTPLNDNYDDDDGGSPVLEVPTSTLER